VLTDGWVDYLTGPFGIVFAFAAGVISFRSPCVLPLVPAYLAHLTGVASDPEGVAGRRETVSHALAFVLGFGVIFTLLGASVGLAGGLLADNMPTLEKIAGVFLIVLGLNLMGILRLPWLYRTYQLQSQPRGRTLAFAAADATGGATATMAVTQASSLSYARSFGLGSAFAVAWTPCIGPVLGAILTLAAASSTVHQGTYLLLAYSAGLAVPFLVAGYTLGGVTTLLGRFHSFLPVLEVGTGSIVLVVGVLVFLNQFTALNQYFDFIPSLRGV
jgi:cytochrome c-type biogenesis protein